MEGITFYEYMDAPDFSQGEHVIRYPVRLSISSDSVSFFVHYIEESQGQERDFTRPHHAEETILCLPFNSSDPDVLSSTIKRVYTTTFPISSSYLHTVLSNRYVKKYEDNDDSQYHHLQKAEVNLDSYSALFVWGLLSKNNRIVVTKEGDDETITKFLRKLLLDFMFDLMHSNVFECSKYYSQMRNGLMSDFFFSSIVKKCEYYYYRRLVRNRFSDIKLEKGEIDYLLKYRRNMRKFQQYSNRKNKKEKSIDEKTPEITQIIDKKQLTDKNKETRLTKKINDLKKNLDKHSGTNSTLELIKKLYANKLDDSESTWIDTIMGPMAEKHFSFSPEWFEDKKPRKKRNRFSVAESWFVNPEEEMARVVFPLAKDENQSPWKAFLSEVKKLFSKKSNTSENIHYLNSFELSELFLTENQSPVLERNTKISKWFYRRFDFVDAFRLHLFQHWNHVFTFFLLVFSGVAMIPGFWECPRNFALFPFAAAIGFLLTSAISARLIWLQKVEKIDDLLVRKRRIKEFWKGIRMFALFIAFWAFLHFYQNTIWWHVLVKGLVFLAIAVPVLYFIPPRVHLVDNIHLFLPRLIASITAAWAMVVIGNEPVQEYLSWPICVILASVVFAFILYESNKSLPTISTGDRIWRALELMLISYSISLIIGFFSIDILTNTLAPQAEEAKMYIATWCFLDNCEPLTITIFPDFLIPFSFLAMFIGVFIQMIFEEKNITEM